MRLGIEKITVYFVLVCLVAMAVPYLLGLGAENVFIKDFYAKRIMTALGLPFFGLIILNFIFKKRLTLSRNMLAYIGLFCIVLLLSILFRNRPQLIFTDAFIAALPIIFYLCVFKTGFDTNKFFKEFNYLLLVAALLVMFGIKLQFSYFSLLAIVYLIFLIKWDNSELLLLLFLPFLIFASLIGKSALLMLIFLIAYFFLFDKRLVSFQKKLYLLLLPSVVFVLGVVIFWEQIQSTGSYKNVVYFLNNTDFSSLSFKDHSTGHRLFEAERVLEEFSANGWLKNLFGHGFGATIDLSDTPDITVTNANENIKEVRHIHMGIFAVLHRYGIIGVSLYLAFMGRVTAACYRVLKRSDSKQLTLAALYLLILLFDSLISFPHMMSNFLFWLFVFIVFAKEKEFRFRPKLSRASIS